MPRAGKPGMRWFRTYSEIKDDPKMLCLTDHQFRIWMHLLAMASEADDRGFIARCPRRGLVAALRTTEEALTEALAVFAELDMALTDPDGTICIIHFMERQYDNPSDYPEATVERKRRQRQRDNANSHEDVTSESRACHDTEKSREDQSREDHIADAGASAVRESPPVTAPAEKPKTNGKKSWPWSEQLSALLEAVPINCAFDDAPEATKGEYRKAAEQIGKAHFGRSEIQNTAAEMHRLKWTEDKITASSIAKWCARYGRRAPPVSRFKQPARSVWDYTDEELAKGVNPYADDA